MVRHRFVAKIFDFLIDFSHATYKIQIGGMVDKEAWAMGMKLFDRDPDLIAPLRKEFMGFQGQSEKIACMVALVRMGKTYCDLNVWSEESRS